MNTCSFADCDKAVAAKALCQGHYRQQRLGLPLKPLRRRIVGGLCSVEGCGRKHRANGLCGAHLERQRRGVPLDAPVREVFETDDLYERLRRYAPVGKPDECWEWTRARNKNYGMISVGDGKLRGAHIVAWELANGQELPPGQLVRHSCDNPPCTNPRHLRVGSHADNTADMDGRGRRGAPTYGFRHRTPDEVTEIRAAAESGVTYTDLARRYECSISAISQIVSGKHFPAGSRRISRSKLTVDDVQQIRTLHANGCSQQQIADQFGLHQSAVSGIVRRRTWKHVE